MNPSLVTGPMGGSLAPSDDGTPQTPSPQQTQGASSVPSSAETNGLVWPGDSSSSQPGAPAQAQAPASMVNGTPAGGAAPAVRKTAGFVPMSDVGKPFHTTLSDPAVQHGFLHSKIAQVIEGKSDQWVQPVDADGNPTGAPVNQPKQNSPGFFFRSLLAGVLAGAASGAGHGVAGAGMGWNAATEMQDKQKAEAHAQAQEQWQNQRQVTEDAQKATAATSEELVRKSTIAANNANTLRLNGLIQGESADRHEKEAAAGRAQIQSYVDAGIDPVVKNIPVSQFDQYVKDHPGSSAYDWEHTGVHYGTDAQGNPIYEETLTAYDPKGKIPVSKATYDQWEKDGVFDRYPEYKDILKPGKTVDATTYVNIKGKAELVRADNLTRNKESLGLQELQAHIDEANSARKAHNAAANESGLSAEEKRMEINRKKEEDAAWDALAAAGNDPGKLKDAHQKTIIARSVQPLMAETLNAIKVATAANDTAELADLWGEYHAYQKLASLGTEAPDPRIPAGALIAVNPTTGEKRYSIDGGKTWKVPGETTSTNALPAGVPPIPANYRGTRENWIAAHTSHPELPEGPPSPLSGEGDNNPGRSWAKQ